MSFLKTSGYCTCGQNLKYAQVSDFNCNTGCSGNTNEYCGGGNLVNVYGTGK